MSPAISVVMPAHDAARYIDDAIRSVRGQTFEDFEFIVVDDGSRDDTVRIVQTHGAEDSRIRLLRQQHGGATAAIIRGMEASTSRYIARMDADDVSHPDRFGRQIAFLNDDASVAVVGSSVEFIDEDGKVTGSRRCPTTHEEIAAGLLRRSPLYHPSVMMRREMIEGVGGYDRRFKTAQDYRLWLSVSARHRLANIDEPLLLYRRHPGQVTQRRNPFFSAAGYVDSLASKYLARNTALSAQQELNCPELVRTIVRLFDAPLLPQERKALFYHVPRLLRCNFSEAWAGELQRVAVRNAVKDRNLHFGMRSLFYRVF